MANFASTMTKDELLARLRGTEWTDFEVKEAHTELPKNVWETVSAFGNTHGGWIVLGVKEHKKAKGATYEVLGVENSEKIEQDFVNTLRSGEKFNQRITVLAEQYNIDGKIILAFYIPMSEHKPVYIRVPSNTYLRIGSGDQRANEYEIRAMQRDQAFGKKSNEAVFGSSFDDISYDTLQDYRNYLRTFNPELRYNTLSDKDFCIKAGILVNGFLTVGGLFMFGKLEAILRYNPDFLVDYIEIPGIDLASAKNRYSYRMQEQDNLWEYFKAIITRLRNRIDNPYNPQPDGVAPDDNTQLYCIREALVNFFAHADYFSEIHSTIRVFDNSISLQNPGAFPVDLRIVGRTIVSQPRNPNLLRFFKLAKLSENGGYGIDKIMEWEKLTGCEVSVDSSITMSEVKFVLPINANQRQSTPIGVKNDVDKQILALIKANPKISLRELAEQTKLSRRTLDRYIDNLKKMNILVRHGSARSGFWEILS